MASTFRFLFGSKIRTALSILVILFGLYTLAGFVIVPWIARPKIVETVSELTGRETRLDTLKLNPFTLSGTLSGFEVTDLDGESLLSFSRAHGNVQALSFLFGGEIHMKELDLADPYFRLQVAEDGALNVADIINQITSMQPEETEEPKETKPLKVDVLKIQNGSITFTDLSRSAPFTSVIKPINFDITSFHTSGESDAPYAFSATSESGESFSWEGFVAIEPVRSKGSFEVKGFSMPKYEPFYDIILRTDVTGGTIGVSGSYDYSSGGEGTMKLIDANVAIRDVEVVNGETQQPVIGLKSGDISGINMDYLTRNIEIQSVNFKEGSMFAKRLANGEIDLIQLLDLSEFSDQTSETENAPETPEPSEAPAPSYHVHEVELEDFTIDVVDEAAPTPAAIALEKASVSVSGVKSDLTNPIGILMSANLRSGGAMMASGSVTLEPLAADLDVEIGNIELKVGNPYLSQFADAQLTGGHVTISGHAKADLSGEKPAGNFAGKVELADLAVIDSDLGQGLTSLTRLTLDGIETQLEPMSVKIGAINIVDPRATVIVNEDSSINLLNALRIERELPTEEEDTEAEAAEPSEDEEFESKPTGFATPFPIEIGSITLANAGAVLNDRSISPAVNLGLETLSGTISGLSSEELARADLDLTGTLVGGTQMAVKGKINPLIEDRYSDIEMAFKGFNLTAVSPYSGKYAGYKLDKGKLSFDLKYKVSQAELSGENVMIIDQLTLGDKVESEDALKLPIPLAVSLMKDRDGVITIDVPVSGNLNDPKFSFGRVISAAIVNVLTKLITSPFSMLGGLIPGGKDVDLSQVNFSPATVDFDGDIEEKLGLLADALKERPNLSIEISGIAGGAAEVNELRASRLETNLKTLLWKEKQDAGNSEISVEQIMLTQSDRTRLIKQAFNTMFPNEAVTMPKIEPGEAELIEPPVPEDANFTDPAAAESASIASQTDEESKGLTGFFRRIFGGGGQDTEPEPAPESVPEEPVQEVAVAEATVDPAEPVVPQLTSPQMEARLLEAIAVTDNDLRELANARAEAVRAQLETVGQIAPERLFVVPPEDPTKISADAGEPQVTFNLE